jgi:DNA-directed RNA polymerase specialized sigma24 family protein
LVLTTTKGDDVTENAKAYLKRYAPAKRLVQFMKSTLENCTSETEKKQIKKVISDNQKLIDEIYALVLQLPADAETLLLIDLRYIQDMSVEEVCSTLHISKSTYHTYHKNALKLLKEMREKK